MTPTEFKELRYAYDNYRFKALLSVLTDEQLKQFNEYIHQHIDDYKATISKFLSPHEVKDVIDKLKKAKKFT